MPTELDDLRAQLAAERAAHAAEVAELNKRIETLHVTLTGNFNMKVFRKMCAEVLRLRAALKGIRTVLSGAAPIDRGIALLHRDREEIEQHLAALAADPGPLVAAVEGMVKALVSLRNEVSGTIFSDSVAILNLREAAGNTNTRVLETRLDEADSAIAAYHAALGGTDGPR